MFEQSLFPVEVTKGKTHFVALIRAFSKSHITLLIFRKFMENTSKRTLELRHQRTGDAVFDYDNCINILYRQ